jgi:type II secretory pathway component PulJ
MAELTPTSLRATILLDEMQQLDRHMLALEKEIKELRAPMAELEAALERKAEAPEEEGSEVEGQRHVSCQRVRVVTAATPDGRDCAALRGSS